MNTDISKPQFHHSKLKCYCSMPVDVPALGKRKSLLTRNSRCRCTFHCSCVSGEVEMMGGMGLVMSLTQGRMTAALFWLLLVPRALFITSLCHMVRWQSIQEKNYCFTV